MELEDLNKVGFLELEALEDLNKADILELDSYSNSDATKLIIFIHSKF